MSIEQEEISTDSKPTITNNSSKLPNYLEEFETINEAFTDEDPE